jgi:hypothetical protein
MTFVIDDVHAVGDEDHDCAREDAEGQQQRLEEARQQDPGQKENDP